MFIFIRCGRVSDYSRRACEGGRAGNQLPVEKDVAKGSTPLKEITCLSVKVGGVVTIRLKMLFKGRWRNETISLD